jgi:hypothetical protein
LTRIVPKPVTRSKGGYRRKPRRITPFVIDNYWPGGQRVASLRRHWGSHKPCWDIIDRINAFPAPKLVTEWQCRMMASHLGLRRPPDSRAFAANNRKMDAATIALRVRNRGPQPQPMYAYEPVPPDHAGKLRKVGRKPKPKKPKKRKTPLPTATEGLVAVGRQSWFVKAGLHRRPGKRQPGKGRKARRTAAQKS